MVKDTSNIFYSQFIWLVKVPENVSCLINTTNLLWPVILTPAASIEREKTIGTIKLFFYGFLIICLSVYSKF